MHFMFCVQVFGSLCLKLWETQSQVLNTHQLDRVADNSAGVQTGNKLQQHSDRDGQASKHIIQLEFTRRSVVMYIFLL